MPKEFDCETVVTVRAVLLRPAGAGPVGTADRDHGRVGLDSGRPSDDRTGHQRGTTEPTTQHARRLLLTRPLAT